MKLTFPTDVIVALSGSAQLVQNATGDEYLARSSSLPAGVGLLGLHGDVGSVPVMGRRYPPPVPRILRSLHRYGGYQASPQQEKTLLHLKHGYSPSHVQPTNILVNQGKS